MPVLVGYKTKSRNDLTNQKAEQAVQQINDDIATLDSTPTNAQVIAILRRTLVRQRKLINYVSTLD